MLSTPCWFIKLIPAQEEADLHTDHGADRKLLGTLACQKQRWFVLTDPHRIILGGTEVKKKLENTSCLSGYVGNTQGWTLSWHWKNKLADPSAGGDREARWRRESEGTQLWFSY